MRNIQANNSTERLQTFSKTIISHDNKKSAKKKKNNVFRFLENKKIQAVILVVLTAVMLCTTIFSVFGTISVGSKAANDTFVDTKASKHSEVYDVHYKNNFDKAEKSHHIQNTVSLQVEAVKKENELEVLKVSESHYYIANENERKLIKDKTVFWLEIPVDFSYTIDLGLAEFVVDLDRTHVLVRLPEPKLSEGEIQESNIDVLFKDESKLQLSKYKDGFTVLENATVEATQEITAKVTNNQEYLILAKESACTQIENLIRSMNPNFPYLSVTIEFIES